MFVPILSSLLLAGSLALAQEPAPSFSVEDAVALAVERNPRAIAAMEAIRAAESGLRSARALTNPTALFIPGLSRGGSDTELLLQQPLELNGTRAARSRAGAAGLRRARAEAVAELRDLVFETKSAWFSLARAQALRSLAGDLLRSSEELDGATRRQVELGSRAEIDSVQTGVEVARARGVVVQAEGEISLALAALNTLIGRAPSDPVGPLSTPALSPMPFDEAALLRSALADRTEIAVAEAAGEAARAEGSLIRAEGRPDLVPQFRASSVTRGPADSGLGIGVVLPFLDYGSRRGRLRQAAATARSEDARAAATRNAVRQEVIQAVSRVRTAEAILREYEGGLLDGAKRLLDGTRKGFLLGASGVTLLTVLEAQRTYRNVQTGNENARVDYAQARAGVEHAAGGVSLDRLRLDSSRESRSR